MGATFRPRKSGLYMALGLTPTFLAWGAATLWLAANDPDVRSPAAFAALSSVPFLMAGLGGWMILNHFRASLTFREGRVVYQGVWKRAEMDLAGVTEARWGQGRVVRLRDASSGLTIAFDVFEKADHEAIVRRLRAAIRPEVQHGWNLYVHQTGVGLPVSREPGPGEVLRTRADMTRLFALATAATIPVTIIAWWWTDRPSAFLAIPGMAAFGLFMRALMPAEGTIEDDISYRANPERVRVDAFLFTWIVAASGLIVAFDRLWDRLPIPVVLAGTIAAAWLAVFVAVMIRLERDRKARDEAAADRAAAERAESGFPSGDVGL